MKQWVFASVTAVALGLVAVHPAVLAATDDKGTIEGRVFADEDGDGIRDAGEKGLEDVTVKLSGKLKRTAETDRNGKFSFDDLADGSYDVTVVLEKDWVAVKDFTAYKDLEVEGATLSDVDFALQDEGDVAVATDTTTPVATATAEPLATEALVTESSDDETAASTEDEATAEAGDADHDAADDGDEADAAGDDEAGDAADDSSMEDAAAELIAGLSGSELDPAVVAALQKALASAQATGGASDVTTALDAALATLPKDARDQAAAVATEIAARDESADHDGERDDDDDRMQAAPATAPQPANTLPETGGGALALGALLAAGLAAMGGAGRLMERRRS
jgi:hypothetical protein